MTQIAALLRPRMVSSEVTTTKRETRMRKIAINRCFGGFGLSDEAFEKLLTRKGIEFEKVVEPEKSSLFGTTYFEVGHVGEDDHYLYEHQFCDKRDDPDLIAVIEEMGDAANGFAAEIAIMQIPSDVEWHIAEYDGLEHVAENHRTWS
jgi:hypothetical protein